MNLKEALDKYGNREVEEDELEKILKPIGRIKPKMGQTYCCIDSSGRVMHVRWFGDTVDNYRWSNHNVYLTEKECRKALEIKNAFIEASFEPDWGSIRQRKWYMYYDHLRGALSRSWCNYCKYPHNYYFETNEIAEDLVSRFDEEDIKKFILNIYE